MFGLGTQELLIILVLVLVILAPRYSEWVMV